MINIELTGNYPQKYIISVPISIGGATELPYETIYGGDADDTTLTTILNGGTATLIGEIIPYGGAGLAKTMYDTIYSGNAYTVAWDETINAGSASITGDILPYCGARLPYESGLVCEIVSAITYDTLAMEVKTLELKSYYTKLEIVFNDKPTIGQYQLFLVQDGEVQGSCLMNITQKSGREIKTNNATKTNIKQYER